MRASRDEWIMRLGVVLLVAWALLSKSFQNADGHFVGLANYLRYFSTPALFWSIFNSTGVAIVTTVIVIPLAFTYAYALTRTGIEKALLLGGSIYGAGGNVIA